MVVLLVALVTMIPSTSLCDRPVTTEAVSLAGSPGLLPRGPEGRRRVRSPLQARSWQKRYSRRRGERHRSPLPTVVQTAATRRVSKRRSRQSRTGRRVHRVLRCANSECTVVCQFRKHKVCTECRRCANLIIVLALLWPPPPCPSRSHLGAHIF